MQESAARRSAAAAGIHHHGPPERIAGHQLPICAPLVHQVPDNPAHPFDDPHRLAAEPPRKLVDIPVQVLGIYMVKRPVVSAPHQGLELPHPVDMDLSPGMLAVVVVDRMVVVQAAVRLVLVGKHPARPDADGK